MLINFWSSTCVPCVRESAALEQLYRQNRRAGLVVLGIDPEDFKSDARQFIERHGISYPNVNDVGSHTADRYGISGTPESFLVDRRGRVVQILIGPIDASANQRPLADALRQILRSST
jgi:cytochrome c biogenesis protein CcmG/thiol:disulfide interchange protein DsbE